MPEIKDITIDRGTDNLFRFVLLTPPAASIGAVGDWTTQFELRTTRGTANTVLTISGAISEEVENANTVGVFDVTLSANAAANLTARTYYYAFVRTNPGFKNVLVKGTMHVEDY